MAAEPCGTSFQLANVSCLRELLELHALLPHLTILPRRCCVQALIEAAMQPGSGRLRLCSDSPAGGGGGSAALDQHLAVPAGPLLHFVYHVPARRQYLAPLPLPPDSAQVGSSQRQISLHPNRC